MLKNRINDFLSNKSILILGFGREGKSTLNYIMKNNISYTRIGVADKNETIERQEKIEYFLGDNYLEAIYDFDVIIKSPGISLKNINLQGLREKITSQTELFLKYGKEKVIGITGTKGKSTTSSLIFQMLSKELSVELVGNIGTPVLDYVDKYEDVNYFVYELSSHQLELVDASPKIAIFLNLYEEHLDYYSSFKSYAGAKQNIFKHQDKTDIFVYNKDMKSILIGDECVKGKAIEISQIESEKNPFKNEFLNLTIDPKDIGLLGIHNLYNLTVAATVAKIVGISDNSIISVIKNLKPLPHRLERIGTYNNIEYIDDSISTIPEATISALDSVPNVYTVLIGGMDRGVNYDMLIEYLSNAKTHNIILMCDSGKRIYEKLSKKRSENNIVFASNLEKAVELATKITPSGTVCLLSPAAASYGFFKNFEERGEKFKEYIKKYSDN